MSDVAFNDSAGMTILEIGMAMLLMRTGSAKLDDFAAEFARQFRVPVDAGDIRPSYTKMLERHWVEPYPTDVSRLVMTENGRAVSFAAFAGFIRLIDPVGEYFKASMVFAMTTRRMEEQDDDD